ncbi:MAG: enoyl-CoA hydratase/isomerase family protein [Pseudomonadota bacterium]
MSISEQLLTHNADGVTTITLNRPDALNALTPEMLGALADALAAAAADEQVRAVVLTGSGRAFSAGVDLKSLNGAPIVDGMVGDVLDVPAQAAIQSIESMPKPVIAKVNGHCFTGALEIVLACDLVYIATGAKLGDTHAKWGLRPTWGMSQRLPRKIGVTRARELSLTAAVFSADEALDWGLANAIADRDALDALVAERVAQICSNSAGAIAAYKDLWRQTFGTSLAEGVAFESDANYRIGDSETRLAEFLK